MSTTSFNNIFDKAFEKAQKIFCKVNNLSAYHETYKPLCYKLWTQEDKNKTGYFHNIDQCKNFCSEMVKNNWQDWKWSSVTRERKIWEALLAIHGRISVKEFLCSSEDPDYPMPEAAEITANHREWKQQGGANPGKACSGAAIFKVIDFGQTDKEKLAREVITALKEDGFFCAINHGVPQELISHTLWMAQEFFARRRKANSAAATERIRIREATRPMMKCARGYSDMFEESLNPTQGPDLKETFDYSLQHSDNKTKQTSEDAATAPSSCTMHLGQNLWPEEPKENEDGTSFMRSTNKNATGFNQFEESGIVPVAPAGFKKTCEEYLDKCYNFSRELFSIIVKGLGLPQSVIDGIVMPKFDDPLVVNRLIHYPPEQPQPQQVGGQPRFQPYLHNGPPSSYPPQPFPQPGMMKKKTMMKQPQQQQQQDSSSSSDDDDQQQGTMMKNMGCGSHIDYGAVTIIFENSSGIEVQRRGHPDEPYHTVPHIPGAAIINTGYVLEKLTNGLLPATRHRVQNKNASDRYSLALFLDPNPNSMVEPLKEMVAATGNEAKYEKCTAGHKGVRFGNTSYLKLAADRA